MGVSCRRLQHIASHVATIFCYYLPKLLQRSQHPRKPSTSHHIPGNPTCASHVATIFCSHLAKLLQKIIASQKNQHIATHVATIFCYQSCKQSTESQIFDAPFWSRNGVSCPHERNKIGDSVLCLQSCYKRAIASPKNQHIQEHIASHHMLLLSFVIILQSCYKRSQHPRKTNTSHHITCCYYLLLSILQSCYKRTQHPRKTNTSRNTSHHITCCYYLLLSSCKVVTKEHSIPEKPTRRITCCYYLLL